MHNLNSKYDANFTAGGLLHTEFIGLEEIVLSDEIEESLKLEETQNQFIGINTIAARKRVLSEVKRRIAHVPKEFWEQLYQWNEREQKLALLYVCLKTYRLVYDLHLEVSLKKYRLGSKLDAYGISMFLDEVASKDDYVATWSGATLEKINVQYRKALKDAGLLKDTTLQKPNAINSLFWNYFKETNEFWFIEACFIV
jgi:hypothetical protein